jgi:SAM-dependent methyltransferase
MSWPRLLRKLRLATRRAPRSARDLVSSYDEYLRLQRETYRSFESDVPAWSDGQRRFLRLALRATPRTARILDCACGDGAGLGALREMGFSSATGVELCGEKAARAALHGFPVVTADMHDLGCFPDGAFDVIVCSHTLEHAYDPGRVVAELHRLLAAEAALHVVLPYPDPGHRNEMAHVGKYELGTHLKDGGGAVMAFFEARGFRVASHGFDSERESEIWLHLEKEKQARHGRNTESRAITARSRDKRDKGSNLQ